MMMLRWSSMASLLVYCRPNASTVANWVHSAAGAVIDAVRANTLTTGRAITDPAETPAHLWALPPTLIWELGRAGLPAPPWWRLQCHPAPPSPPVERPVQALQRRVR